MPLPATLCNDTWLSMHQVLTQAKLEWEDIDRVLLVGGTTRIPAIRAMLLDFFDGKVELNHQVLC